MAAVQDAFESMDDDTARLVIQLQLDDLAQRTVTFEDNPEAFDADLAVTLLRRDLETAQIFLEDRCMSRSITAAVIQDGHIVAVHATEEEEARRDHYLARRMSLRRVPEPAQPQPVLEDPELARLAGAYVSEEARQVFLPQVSAVFHI